VALTVLRRNSPDDVRRFIGDISPTLAAASTTLIAASSLEFARRRGFWSEPDRRDLQRGLAMASAAAVPFAGVAIAADLIHGFPADLNVGFPRSLAFYPAIAIVAESTFHAAPLGGVLAATGWLWDEGQGLDRNAVIATCIVAAVEPCAQAALGSTMLPLVVPHVAAIGVFQIALLRWAGYIPMLWFRLAYYALWHIAWGMVRPRLTAEPTAAESEPP
jgi:hypothetical protein